MEQKKPKSLWNILSWLLVIVVVLLTILVAGLRLMGLRPFVVMSGSMEPEYQTGALIFVKQVDPFRLQAGDVITYMLNEDTVATHRVMGVVPDEEDSSVIRFRTKGDANESEDATLVHYKNVIGQPVLDVPYVGYVINYISAPPGLYVALIGLGILILLMFAPNLLRAADAADKRDAEKKKARQQDTSIK